MRVDDWTDRVSFVGSRTLLFHCLLSLEELLLPHLQLQHDGAQLHVQIVSPLQLPLIVLPDIQSMPADESTASALMTRTVLASKHQAQGDLSCVYPKDPTSHPESQVDHI